MTPITMKVRIPTAQDRAVTAIRLMHALRVAEWYPGGQRDGYPPPGYLFTDLDHDERAIRSWPERQAFGWIVGYHGTYILQACERSARCLTATLIADTLRGTPLGFYAWNGRTLDGVRTAAELDAWLRRAAVDAPVQTGLEMAW